MIRFACTCALACIIANTANAQPVLVPPTPSDSAPTIVPSAPQVDQYEGVAPAVPHSPSDDYAEPVPSYSESYQPTYETPYSQPKVTYDHQAPSQGCASCNGTSALTGTASYGAYAPTTNFIGQSHSSFGGVPSTSSAAEMTHPYMGGASASGLHVRHPYYGYRHPWTTRGPASLNVTITW